MTSRRSRLRKMRQHPHPVSMRTPSRMAVGLAAALAGLAITAFINERRARKAERDNPPAGRFIEVEGVRLHVVERGQGEPLVLLHGNGSMIQDFETSGLLDMAAKRYRVIAFDRPGYGHSERPRTRIWTDTAQADLVHAALAQMGVERATILGHSWGASVALAMAQRHPQAVASLVLASGYFYPTVRVDMVALSGPAIPVIGDLLRYTVAPIASRLIWPALTRKIFGPAPVPEKFDRFPKEMSFRPSQLRASAAESALLIPDAFAARGHYGDIDLPVVIIAGDADRLIDLEDHSARLHGEIAGSTLHRVAGAGHMVHQTATDQVMAAIDEAVEAGRRSRPAQEPRLRAA